jgi:hypothetical protein
LADKPRSPDILSLAESWGWDDLQRVQEIYGSISAPGTKKFGDLIQPFKVERGKSASATKQQKGGFAKSLNAISRLTEMRLVYLTLTLDMGMDQLTARSEMAKMYELSKSRIRDLVSAPKNKTSKK